MTFGVWLKNEAANDADARAIQDFADAQLAKWPFHSNNLSDYLDSIATNANEAQRKDLLLAVGRSYPRWTAANPIRAASFGEVLRARFGSILLAIFGVVIAVILVLGIFDEQFLTSMSKPEQARGLITFLFAFSTIAMFLLIAIATFWMEKGEAQARFALAKDLITIVIGVLGTILGFYFGSLASDQAQRRGMYLANVAVSEQTVAPGTPVVISGVILGGTGPYEYDVKFSDPTGNVVTQGLDVHNKTEDGTVNASVTVPAAKAPSSISFTVSAKDAKGTLAQSFGVLFVQPKPATTSPPGP